MILKNLKILILVSLGSLIIASGIYYDSNNQKNEISAQNLVPSFSELLEKITYIEFSNNQDKSVIEDIDNQWLVTTLDNFPANTELLSRFFIQLREAEILGTKTNREDLLYKLGLDEENKTRLILKSSDNEEIYSLDIGSYNYNIPGTYVKDPNSSQSYIVNSNLSTDTSSFYWIPTDLLNIGKLQIKSVQIYNQNMLNLENDNGNLIHTNLPEGFSDLNEDKVSELERSLTDLQHNGFMLRNNLPNSSNFKSRYTLANGTVLFINFYDIPDEGIYVTFDWNYINDDIQISKFIDPILNENQLQISTLSLLENFAYRVPQLFFDNHNLKIREKSE